MKLLKKRSVKLEGLFQYFLALAAEMALVDLSFACVYNLVSDYKNYHMTEDNLGRTLSFVFLSAIILHYLRIGEKVIYSPEKLAPHEKMMIEENLKSMEMKKDTVPLHLINVLFKLKIILLMTSMIVF
jgi:hypothetical protein